MLFTFDGSMLTKIKILSLANKNEGKRLSQHLYLF